MDKKVFIGIDVSKLKLDLCVIIGDKISQAIVLSNTISELKKFFKILIKDHNKSELLFCSRCKFRRYSSVKQNQLEMINDKLEIVNISKKTV
jgi:hypothetical protein